MVKMNLYALLLEKIRLYKTDFMQSKFTNLHYRHKMFS